MTPKEKAIELFDKMYSINIDEFISIHASKNAAKISVDEILKALESDWSFMEVRQEYWQEVKQEIEKL
jgi:hypothetical protein